MKILAPHYQRGFTLIEAVVVMVITGILATMMFSFLKFPVRNYFSGVARAAAADAADTSMRRIARDLRLALPNSIRHNPAGTYIEYLETKVGLRYLGDDDVNSAGGDVLSWDDPAKTLFSVVVAEFPTGSLTPTTNDYIVIYNLGENQEPGNAYSDCSSACNITKIQQVDSAGYKLRMTTNVFAGQTAAGVALKSPGKRFHVVTGPVTYRCDTATGRLIRYWDYPIATGLSTPPVGGKSAILAENLTGCSFTYATMANQRSALVGIRLDFQIQDETKGIVSLYHQIHVSNTP